MKFTCKLHDADSLPISLFKEIQKTANFLQLVNDWESVRGVDLPSKEYLSDVWAQINDEITAIVGANEDYIEYLNHKAKAVSLRNEARVTGNRFLLTWADIETSQAQEYENSGIVPRTFAHEFMELCKMQGYHIDKDKISVREYYTLIQITNDSNQKHRSVTRRDIQ